MLICIQSYLLLRHSPVSTKGLHPYRKLCQTHLNIPQSHSSVEDKTRLQSLQSTQMFQHCWLLLLVRQEVKDVYSLDQLPPKQYMGQLLQSTFLKKKDLHCLPHPTANKGPVLSMMPESTESHNIRRFCI